MRRGEKLEALKLAAGSWRAARTNGEAFKLLAGLLLPRRLLARRQARRQERAAVHYGAPDM
jgi:hypothetical protein